MGNKKEEHKASSGGGGSVHLEVESLLSIRQTENKTVNISGNLQKRHLTNTTSSGATSTTSLSSSSTQRGFKYGFHQAKKQNVNFCLRRSPLYGAIKLLRLYSYGGLLPAEVGKDAQYFRRSWLRYYLGFPCNFLLRTEENRIRKRYVPFAAGMAFWLVFSVVVFTLSDREECFAYSIRNYQTSANTSTMGSTSTKH